MPRTLRALAHGDSIERPVYDFSPRTRACPTAPSRSAPARFSSSKGYSRSTIRNCLPLYQLRVYIDTPEELCFERRLKRDIEERGRTSSRLRSQYESTVRPSSVSYVRPSAVNADLIVDGAGALDWKVERVMAEMRDRGLLARASKLNRIVVDTSPRKKHEGPDQPSIRAFDPMITCSGSSYPCSRPGSRSVRTYLCNNRDNKCLSPREARSAQAR